MRLICLWCALLAAARADDAHYYAPQTFAQAPGAMFRPADSPAASSRRNTEVVAPHYGGAPLFRAADVAAQGTIAPPSWRSDAGDYDDYNNYNAYNRGPEERRPEPWRLPYGISKEQQAAILHHKQSLSSEGAFRFEYASDNGLAAGEVIEPDGSRVGAYQYKDPSGQLVKLKYRAGKQGFQILEGSHLPKSPEPAAPAPHTDDYYTTAYEQQRRQYELQQQYNTQRPEPKQWPQESQRAAEGAGRQPYAGSWAPDARDDGQYRDNELEEQRRGPHSFGEGYAFAFKG